ncbi:MAG TPA: hypothetical protein VKF59_08350 [Candidatus Dormibacteraeota bacterium]|nr:hypothetical protein [Candidatus Dormibacteraeota bacterium]
MGGSYEVLSPWAEVDPVPLEGISPRLPDLRGRRIGLFHNGKVAAAPILDAVQAELSGRFDGLTFARFGRSANLEVAETPDRSRYEEWVKEVDAVVLAVGD